MILIWHYRNMILYYFFRIITNHFYSCQIIQYHEIYFSLLTSLIITFIRCLFNIYVICKYFCYDLFLYCNGIRLTLLYEVVATLSPVESNDTFNILPGPSWDRISWPELIFQKCTTPSFPAVVKMFSFLGETAILFTRSRWSSSLKTHSPFKVFQIRIVPSNDEDIRRSPI